MSRVLTVLAGCGLALSTALPGAAQTPTPTATPVATATATPAPTSTPTPTPTPVATATATPVPTPTPTPGTAAISAPESVVVGEAVVVSGTAPDGVVCLCVVPAGVFTVGAVYGGTPVQCTETTVTGGSFEDVTVLEDAAVGSYDVLLLDGPCSAAPSIIAGQHLDERVGLVVRQAPGIPALGPAGWIAALLLVTGAGLLILRRL